MLLLFVLFAFFSTGADDDKDADADDNDALEDGIADGDDDGFAAVPFVLFPTASGPVFTTSDDGFANKGSFFVVVVVSENDASATTGACFALVFADATLAGGGALDFFAYGLIIALFVVVMMGCM